MGVLLFVWGLRLRDSLTRFMMGFLGYVVLFFIFRGVGGYMLVICVVSD